MNYIQYHQFLLAWPGGMEWVLIGLVILLFFGGKKIPDLMRGLGRGVKEFNDARGKKENKDVKGGAENQKISSPDNQSEK